MMESKIRTKQINKKAKASVLAYSPETDLDAPLWAVNWFDIKNKWLYDLYNKLAYPHVKKVGGKPIFKGTLEKQLLGNEKLKRDTLLIVEYPKADAFLKMLSNRLFQIKSLLRRSATDKYLFGMANKLNQGKEPERDAKGYKGKLKYLVHIYEGTEEVDAAKLTELASNLDVFTHFIGTKAALLGLEEKENVMRTIPFPINGLLLFGAFENAQFDQLIQSDYYQQLITKMEKNYLGVFKREV